MKEIVMTIRNPKFTRMYSEKKILTLEQIPNNNTHRKS